MKKGSTQRIEIYADEGSPCLVPLSKRENPVEWPLFTSQLSALLKKVLTHLINRGPHPNDVRTANKIACSIKSNTFSKSTENNIPDVPFFSVYSSISLIRRKDSPMYLPFTYAVWSHLTILLKCFSFLK